MNTPLKAAETRQLTPEEVRQWALDDLTDNLYKASLTHAILLFNIGDAEGAARVLDASARPYPDPPGAFILKARIAQSMGDLDEAWKIIEEALSQYPSNNSVLLAHLKIAGAWKKIPVFVNDAIMLLERDDFSELTMKAIKQVSSLDGYIQNFSDAYVLGRLYLLAGKFEKAKEHFNAAPEKSAAAFEIAAMEFLQNGKAINSDLYDARVHPNSLLKICLDHLRVNDREAASLRLLTSVDLNVPAAPPLITPFFFNTMPKAGSTFIANAVCKISGAEKVCVTQTLENGEIIVPHWLDKVIASGQMPTGHMCPTEHNRSELERHELPVFLITRDPREATWSWFLTHEDQSTLAKFAIPYLPRDYVDRPRDERITIMFRHHYPHLIRWLGVWKDFLETSKQLAMVARYEDFAADNAKTIANMLTVFGIKAPQAEIAATLSAMREEAFGKKRYHFRKGLASTLREEAPAKVRAAMDREWDDEIMSYFGYNK